MNRFRLVVALVGSMFLTSCSELFVLPEPSPPPSSCSDLPERAALEDAEARGYEVVLACLIKNHPEQRRPTMSYHPLLGEVARMRAQDMADHGYYGKPDAHIDRHGYGPNHYICLTGYAADFCPVTEIGMNTVEVIAASYSDRDNPSRVIAAWLDSPGHRRSILAETENRLGRIYFGAGYAYTPSSPDHPDHPGHYWVFLTVRPPVDEFLDQVLD